MKAFTSHSTLCTKRGTKIPRGNQQLKTKQAVKNRFGIKKLHSLPSARQFLIHWCGGSGTINVPSDSQADCALLQARAVEIVL